MSIIYELLINYSNGNADVNYQIKGPHQAVNMKIIERLVFSLEDLALNDRVQIGSGIVVQILRPPTEKIHYQHFQFARIQVMKLFGIRISRS